MPRGVASLTQLEGGREGRGGREGGREGREGGREGGRGGREGGRNWQEGNTTVLTCGLNLMIFTAA